MTNVKGQPLKSRLVVDGELTEIRIPGYSLLHQFDIPDGFLLVTDYDCPFEEATDFIYSAANCV